MATTTEKEITTELGDATSDQVLEGVTYSSDNGIMLTGTLNLGEAVTAGTITYDNSGSTLEANYVQQAIDELDTKVENKSEKGHTHDDRYYTETEVNALVTALENSISGNADDITALTTKVTTNTTNIATNKSNIATNTANIQKLQVAEDITETDTTTMKNSYPGILKFKEIGAYLGEETPAGNQMFNIDSLESGKIDYYTGDEENSLDYERSNFIAVTAGKTYCFSGLVSSASYEIFHYDKNKNYIRCMGFGSSDSYNAFTISTAGTAYIRLVAKKGYFDNNFMMNAGSTALAWEAFSAKHYVPQESTTGAQLFDISTFVTNQYFNASTGAIEANASWGISDYISVDSTEYVISQKESNLFQIQVVEYDADKNYLSVNYYSNTANSIAFTITSTDTTYIRINYSVVVNNATVNRDEIMLNLGTTALPWETYTGGTASPNPSYPQEICTVKGKNLLDCRGRSAGSVNGIQWTPVCDNNGNLLYIEANGTATADSIYFVQASEEQRERLLNKKCILSSGIGNTTHSDVFVQIGLYDGVKNVHTMDYDNVSFTFTNASEYYNIVCVVKNGATVSNVKVYPMIRPASVADDTYVPYGLLRVKTRGKQLFDHRINNGVSKTNNGVTYVGQPDGSYKRSGTVVEGGTAGNIWLFGNYNLVPTDATTIFTLEAGSTYYIADCTLFSGTKYNTSVDFYVDPSKYPEGFKVTGIRNYWFKPNMTYDDTVYPLVCKIEDGTEWQPYQESSIILSEPIELCGIGEVQDAIDVENGVVRRNIKKAVYKGDITTVMADMGGDNRFSIGEILAGRTALDSGAFTKLRNTHFIVDPAPIGANNKDNVCCGYWNNNNLYVRADQFATVDEFTAYFVKNPMIVYYAIEETTELLPTADRIALNSLLTYADTTYLEWDCYLEPTFKGKYGTSKVGGVALRACAEGCIAGIVTDETIELGTDIEV